MIYCRWCFIFFSLIISVAVIYSKLFSAISPGVIVITLFLSILILYLFKNKIGILITVSIYCFFISAWRIQEKSDGLQSDHFIHAIENNNIFRAKLTNKLKMGKTMFSVFKIDSLNNKRCKGQFINKCGLISSSLKVGDIIYTENINSNLLFKLSKIEPFLYKYWSSKQIYYELKGCFDFEIIKSDLSASSDMKLTGKKKIKDWLLSSISEDNAYLIYGFITGQKQYIKKDIKQNLAIAGVYHILAVSGLHIGIVFLIFQKLLSLISRLKVWHPFIISFSVIGVWVFCWFTDLSPSAIRASLMITLICLGKYILKDLFCHKNIIQLFFVCLFFNLIYDPAQLFNISFQFSYLAYGGILVYYKRLNSLNPISNKQISKIWSLSSISLSAQCAILPLSILYFKYFSSYFILGNLLITPLIPLVYILCLLSILSPFEFISVSSNFILEYLTEFIIRAATIISSFKWSKIEIEGYDIMDCFILYLLLFSWTIIFIINKNKYWVVFCLSLVLSLFLFNYSKNYQIHKNKLSYESIDNKPIIKLQEDNKNYYYNFNCINNDILETLTLNKKGNYMITRCKPSFQYINKVNTKLLVLNEYNINTRSDLKNFKEAEYLLLVNSPFINFRLIKEELPLLKLVLFDRSNKKAYINTWKKLCYRYNIKYLYVFKDFKFIE